VVVELCLSAFQTEKATIGHFKALKIKPNDADIKTRFHFGEKLNPLLVNRILSVNISLVVIVEAHICPYLEQKG
jgi:hypothetical protein